MSKLEWKLLRTYALIFIFIFLYGGIEIFYLSTNFKWIIYFSWIGIGAFVALIKIWRKK